MQIPPIQANKPIQSFGILKGYKKTPYGDYTARKVAFEVAKKLKELHPEIEMPNKRKNVQKISEE